MRQNQNATHNPGLVNLSPWSFGELKVLACIQKKVDKMQIENVWRLDHL